MSRTFLSTHIALTQRIYITETTPYDTLEYFQHLLLSYVVRQIVQNKAL